MDFQVAPSPHFSNPVSTTRRMMLDVLIGLAPVIVVSLIVFRWSSLLQLGLCVISSMAAEAVFTKMRGHPLALGDLSAIVTGLLLGLSLPATAPIHIGIIGSIVAIGLGKVVFGGLGYNLFNPAMVGRAFVMLSFAAHMGAPAYVLDEGSNLVDRSPIVLTQATPLTVAKKFAAEVVAGKVNPDQVSDEVRTAAAPWPLFLGNVNGSVGETSALAEWHCRS